MVMAKERGKEKGGRSRVEYLTFARIVRKYEKK